jgi:hypothetical protein
MIGRGQRRLSWRNVFRSSSTTRHIQPRVDGAGSTEPLLPAESRTFSGATMTATPVERTLRSSDDTAVRRATVDGNNSLFGPFPEQSASAGNVPVTWYPWLDNEWSFSGTDVVSQGR